jgi:hypothetical protein
MDRSGNIAYPPEDRWQTTAFPPIKIMHLLLSPELSNIYYVGGGSLGLILIIVVVVLLLR